jgi:hypothetical protein
MMTNALSIWLLAPLLALAACGPDKVEPAPGQLEKFVAGLDAAAEAERAALIARARAREQKRARESVQRLDRSSVEADAAKAAAAPPSNR